MIDLVIQGGWWPSLYKNANRYANLNFISRVIVSTWEDAPDPSIDLAENVHLLKNKYPSYIGPGNLNLHLTSALNGIRLTSTDIIVKVRSDQIIYDESIKRMKDFYDSHKSEETICYLDGSRQKSKVFITGNGSWWPYHPQDHTFWGHREDIERIFDIPHSNDPALGPEPIDFSIRTGNFRNPVYIGAHYYAQFYERAKYHLENKEEFLLDGAPRFNEALEYYTTVRDTVFKPFPVTNMWWEKYCTPYKYELYRSQGEYYSDEV